VLRLLDVAGPLAAFEVHLDAIPLPKARSSAARPALELSPFQPVERDFAFVVEAAVPAADVVQAVRGPTPSSSSSVRVRCLQGEGIGSGRKSLAVTVTLQPRDRTLTDSDDHG
jgi:phenylalanyl-tRNA synthetase beta chain